MKLTKAKLSLLAVITAFSIALSGTLAWQGISQQALNEAMQETNPGGRLHDDFSGWNEGSTKDIYVENFGTQPIYARVRLDEYMEIGQGAGLKSGDAGYAGKNVTVVNGKPGADINDVTTWSTHIPDSTVPQLPGSPATDQFHDYWTWVMGGETTYMPTFNKNKDSLKADINGTWDGLNAADDNHYDDYHAYSDGETADGVRDTTAGKGAFYDCDDNTDDEGGPYGNGGGLNVNYEVRDETHTAKATENGRVITMADYKALSDAEKAELKAWVYDADGWAYWSQPIEPETATGLLLDQIVLDNEPSDAWYYGINAVGQFITAGDLGRGDNTGFYDPNGGPEPSDDALDLLDGIGVNTSSVKGTIAVTAKAGTPGQAISYASPNMAIDLSALVSVTGETNPDQGVTWQLTGAKSPNTRLSGTKLTIDPNEPDGTILTIVARSTAYDGLKGKLNLKVRRVTFGVDILDSDSNSVKGQTVEFLGGTTGRFTLKITSTPAGLAPAGSWTWTSSNSNVATVSNGTVTIADSAAIGATATITATNNAYSPALTASFTVKVKTLLPEDITPGSTTTTTIDGIEWYVLAKQMVTDTSGTVHNGALLLSKDILETMAFSGPGTVQTVIHWEDCDIRPYLNGSWLSGKSTISSKAILTTISTREAFDTPNRVDTDDKIFLLSEADVFGGVYADGTLNLANPQPWEYTAGAQLTLPNNNQATGGGSADQWWLRSNAGGYSTIASVDKRENHTYYLRSYPDGGVRPAFWYDMGTAAVTFSDPDILDGSSNSVKDQTVEVGRTANFTATATSSPAGVTPSPRTWTWASSDTNVATVSGGTVIIAKSAAVGDTATITATNNTYTPALTVSFTVQARELTIDDITPGSDDTVTIDNIEWYVLAKQQVTGTDGNAHNAALLLSKDIVETMAFSGTSLTSQWQNSAIKSYLNGTWLSGKSEISSKAILTTISTRDTPTTTNRIDTTDKIFLLSEADVFGTSSYGTDKNPQAWEYTIGKQLTLPNDNIANNTSTGATVPWFLRSHAVNANYVAAVNNKGDVYYDHCSGKLGLRPAFWYNLDA